MPSVVSEQAPVPPPAYHRAQARLGPALHIDALTLVRTLHLLALCRLAVRLARRRCPPPLPAGPGGAPRTYSEESLLLLALLRTLWRLSYQDLHDWLTDWPALALACGLPLGRDGRPRIPSPSQQCKRAQRAGAPVPEALFVLSVLTAMRRRLIGARDLIIDSAPILAWHRADPDAAIGHAPAQHPRPLLRGYRVHTLLCRGSGLPSSFCSPPPTSMMPPLLARCWNGPCASMPSARASSAWMPPIGACASSPGSMPLSMPSPSSPGIPSGRRTVPACLPPGPKRNSASAVPSNASLAASFLFFHLQRPPLSGWSAMARQVALTYTASIIVGLAAQHAGRPELIRSPKRVLAHSWEAL